VVGEGVSLDAATCDPVSASWRPTFLLIKSDGTEVMSGRCSIEI